MVNSYNSNSFYFDKKKYINKNNRSNGNNVNLSNEGIIAKEESEYFFQNNDRFDTYKGLFNTQQLIGSIDFDRFENHCFFDSAVSKTEYSFNQIYDKFPIDGSKQEVQDFLNNIDGFTRNIYNQIEKNIGYLKFNNSYISVKNESGYLFSFQRNEKINSKLTNSFLSPKNNSFSFDFRCFINDSVNTNQVIFQYLNTNLQNGLTCWIKNIFSIGQRKYANICFSLTNNDQSVKNFILCKFFVEINKWNHIIISIKKDNKSSKEIDVILNEKVISFEDLLPTTTIENLKNYKIESFEYQKDINIEDSIYFNIGKGQNHLNTRYSYFNLNSVNNYNGYLDEFRYFHCSLDKNFSIKYKDQNIFEIENLKLYFKFNEPDGLYQNNSIVFDHSGYSLHSRINLNNSNIVGNDFRNQISLLRQKSIGNSSLKYENIDLNPVLIPSYQRHIDLNKSILEEAQNYDRANPNLIFKLIPKHYLLQSADQDGYIEDYRNYNSQTYNNDSYTNDLENFPGQQKAEASQTFANILIVWARFFDQLKLYLQILPKMIEIDYSDINKNSIVNFFIPLMSKLNGFEFKEILNSPVGKLLDGYISGKDPEEKSNLTLRYIQNEIWKRVLINSNDIITSKGTIASIRSIFNSVGIIPEEYYRFREYRRIKNKFIDDSYISKNKNINYLNFYNRDFSNYINNSTNLYHEYYYNKNKLMINQPNFNFQNYIVDNTINFNNICIEFLLSYSNLVINNDNILIESILKFENPTEEFNPVKFELIFVKESTYSTKGNLYLFVRSNDDYSQINFDIDNLQNYPCLRNVELLDGSQWHFNIQFLKNIPTVNEKNEIILTVQRAGNVNKFDSKKQIKFVMDINNIIQSSTDIFDNENLRITFGSRKSIDEIQNSGFRAGTLFPEISPFSDNVLINNFSNIINNDDLFENYINFNGNISNIKIWKKLSEFSNSELDAHALNPSSIYLEELIYSTKNLKKISDFLLLNVSCQHLLQDYETFNNNSDDIKSTFIKLIDYSQNLNLNLSNSQYKEFIDYGLLTTSNENIVFEDLINTISSGKSLNIHEFDIKFDELNESNKVSIGGYFNEELSNKENVEIAPFHYVNQNFRVKNNNKFSIEMSNVKHLNEDISILISNLDYFSNLLTDFANLNEIKYIDLENIQNLYFQRITSTKLKMTPLYEIYQIFDNILTEMLTEFIASRVNFYNNIYVIESHALERHKFNYKYSESQNVIKGNYYYDSSFSNSNSFIYSKNNSIRSINYLNKEGRIYREHH